MKIIQATLICCMLFSFPLKDFAQIHSDVYTNLGSSLVDPDFAEFCTNKWIAPTVGISRGYGEMAGITFVYYGLSAYACVGKDWLSDSVNRHKLLWRTGLGYTNSFFGNDFNPHSSLMAGLSFSKNSQYLHHALMLDGHYYRWIGSMRKLGIFVGAGVGIANLTNKSGHLKFACNIEVGLSFQIRFHQKSLIDFMLQNRMTCN